ncbi:MAG: hypothetical protein LBF22_15630 [Deltaproteobacteria bacterium]|jgi:hypothetical protein|nr:hypothetical protein [Deltaproteobacteria bacterium]
MISLSLNRIFPFGRGILKLSLASFIIIFVLTGCFGPNLDQTTMTPEFYPKCYEPIQTLKTNQETLKGDVIKGAILGGLSGGVAGLLAGGGDLRYIIGGVIAGALAGAAVSYIATKNVQDQEYEKRFEVYNATMDQDFQNLDTAAKLAQTTATCYRQQYDQLKKDVKAKKITNEQMLAKLQEINKGTTIALAVLEQYNKSFSDNIQTYDAVYVAEKERTPEQNPAPSQNVQAMQKKQQRQVTRHQEFQRSYTDLDALKTAAAADISNIYAGNLHFEWLNWPEIETAATCIPCSTRG